MALAVLFPPVAFGLQWTFWAAARLCVRFVFWPDAPLGAREGPFRSAPVPFTLPAG